MNNDWLDIVLLEDYLDGKLDAQAMHRVEREALEDPFVAEALEGLRATPRRKQTLSILQKRLHDRINNQPVKRKLWGITTQRLSIAATATVAFIAVSILFIMRETNRRNQIAKLDHKEVMVTLDSNHAVAKQKSISNEASKKIEEQKTSVIARNKPISAKSAPLKAMEKDSVTGIDKEGIQAPSVISADNLTASAALQKKNQIRSIVQSSASGLGISKRTNEVLTGKVVSKTDGLPLPGVTLRLEGSNVSTTTDKNGNFTLVADSTKNNNLLASYLGYKSKTIVRKFVPENKKSKSLDSANVISSSALNRSNLVTGKVFNISLELDDQALSEVVVAGNKAEMKSRILAKGNTSSTSTIMATESSPVDGWIKWRDYLQKNNRVVKDDTAHKEVVLGFYVSNQGAPIYIKVIKGVGKKENEEAIRLLKDGPLWQPVDNEVQVMVAF